MTTAYTPITGTPIPVRVYSAMSRNARRRWFFEKHTQCIDVPHGWACVVDEMVHRVAAIVVPRREALPYFSIARIRCVDGVDLHVGGNTAVPGVEGVVRKFRVKARQTCQTCGTPGRVRALDEYKKAVLCAVCAAPLLLLDDVETLRETIYERGVDHPVDLRRIPPALRAAFCAWVVQREPGHGEIAPWHLFEWVSALESVACELTRQRATLLKTQ